MGRRQRLMDAIDRQIISILEKNPATTQVEMSRKVGISQSSIAIRLERLRRSGLLRTLVGVDIRKAGLYLGRVDVTTRDASGLLSFARKCPLFVAAHTGVGGRNVTLYYVAEDVETFRSLVNEKLGRLESVLQVDFQLVFPSNGGVILPVETYPDTGSTPPCGLPFCPGCPSDLNYKGRFWRGFHSA